MAAETIPLNTERRSLWNPRANHYFIPSSYQAYRLLHFGYILLPLAAGIDKFFHLTANWTTYLSPRIVSLTGVQPQTFMYAVGVIEIVAGLLVAFRPQLGGFVVAAWLWGIIINLLSIPGYYDIALRDFGLSLGALALARLAMEFQHYRKVRIERWSPLSSTEERPAE